MSFSVTFLGARVRGFTSSVGWNLAGPSQLAVQLVDDQATGAAFAPPPVGTPVVFGFFGFNFTGLFQKWEQKLGPDGNPVYEAVVVDPREILDGAQVILGGFSGATSSVPNLYNAFGYWESGAFGAAEANDGGMPWWKVRDALVRMANTPGGTGFGGPLTFRGATYSLDLSGLPSAPPYYRVGGGTAMSLLELVAQVCEDGGCDFFVELRGFRIVVRTVSRAQNPPLGVLSALAASNYGATLVRSNAGLECRNELTSAFLVGGDVTELHTTDGLKQMWGFDLLGNPITGTKKKQDVYEPLNDKLRQADGTVQAQFLKKLGTITYEEMTLNASCVADVVGALTYKCSTWEMRAAQTNQDTWLAYMNAYRKDVVKTAGLANLFDMTGPARALLPGNNGPGVAMRNDWVDKGKPNVEALARGAVASDAHARSVRLYEFVKGTADEYYGRKYLAPLPFLLSKTEPETLKVTTSWEVTDGGYQPEGSAPLGLSPLNEDLFKTQDGRFRAFATFTRIDKVDLTRVPAQGAVIDQGALYMEMQVEPRVYFLPAPYAVVTLNGPVVEVATDNVGDLSLLALSVGGDQKRLAAALQNAPVPLKMAPPVKDPTAAAVPLRSNVMTYGPWGAAGAPGKVRFEHDGTLTPWGYGTFEAMNQAAGAKVAAAVTRQQVFETGAAEVEGAPAAGLGDVLEFGGPNITNVDVQVGKDGVTTSYRYATFTTRLGGLFSRGTAERVKRMGLAAAELRKGLRAAVRDQQMLRAAARDAARTQKAFHERQARALKRETPHDVLHAFSARDKSNWNVDKTRVHASMTTLEEALVLSNAHDKSLFQQTAYMSLSGLVRPFSTETAPVLGDRPPDPGPTPSGADPFSVAAWVAASSALASWVATSGALAWYAASGVLPRYEALATPPFGTDPQTRTSLDPFQDKNRAGSAEVLGGGTEYGFTGNSRPLGLRAPVILVGWGYDVHGRHVPSSGDGTYMDVDAPTRQDKWKVGALDPLWDPYRGVWTVHGNVKGRILEDGVTIGGGGNGKMTVDGWTKQLTVYNCFSSSVAGTGLVAIATYVPTDNRWYLVAVDCPP